MSDSFLQTTVVPVLYLFSAVLFILGLKGLTKVRTAQRGNAIAAFAMLIAVVATLLEMGTFDLQWILLGLFAIIFATVNVVGGFLVTNRMLGMFGGKKKISQGKK